MYNYDEITSVATMIIGRWCCNRILAIFMMSKRFMRCSVIILWLLSFL